MKRIFKLLGWSIVIALIVLQFFQPEMNESTTASGQTFAATYKVSDEVSEILSASCYDCHSNNTKPMWYMHMQPVGMWVMHHVEEGKEELNFDEFTSYSPRRQYHKLEEIAEQVNEDEMPLSSYTLVHGDASLDDAGRKTLVDWVSAMMDTMEAHYPMDSLVMKR